MGIVTTAELFSHLQDNPMNVRTVNDSVNWRWGDSEKSLPESFTMEDVENFLDTIHTRIIDGNFLEWKSMRPWEIVDIAANLDPSKPWIGWEVETGWNTREARSQALQELFDSYNHVATDSEGPEYGVEMTWSPAVNGKYEGQHPLLFVVDMAAKYDSYDHDMDSETGTHVNISTPTFRTLHEDQAFEVVNALNHALEELTDSNREELFGRSRLYGGFFLQEGWVEGKMFNTTYSRACAERYIMTAERLATVVEGLAQFVEEHCLLTDKSTNSWSAVYNWNNRVRVTGFYDHLIGAENALRMKLDSHSYRANDHDIGGYDRDFDSDGWCNCDDCVEAREESW
nr:MAG TPA_asm: hypothetical protein [Caudoviricetes sp.]